MNISFAIIGNNEANLLEGCLESIKDLAAEIIYVDCESSDNSLDIALKYGAKVFKRKNDFNLNVNKQFAIDNCTSEWIFYIDPDERLTDDLENEILITLKNTDADAFLIPRKNYYFGRWLKHGGKYPDRQLRIFRKGKAAFECKSIHERIKVNGKVDFLVSPFEHIVVENTDRLLMRMNRYAYLGAFEMIRLNRDPKKLVLKSIKKFLINYFIKLGFLDGKEGFFAAIIDLFNSFLYYFKYQELRKNSDK